MNHITAENERSIGRPVCVYITTVIVSMIPKSEHKTKTTLMTSSAVIMWSPKKTSESSSRFIKHRQRRFCSTSILIYSILYNYYSVRPCHKEFGEDGWQQAKRKWVLPIFREVLISAMALHHYFEGTEVSFYRKGRRQTHTVETNE